MGYTERIDARNQDSITLFDSTSLTPGVYTSSTDQLCSGYMISSLVAVKGAGNQVQCNATASGFGSISSISLAFSSNNTAGNCLIVTAFFGGTFPANNATISDSQGNMYTLLPNGHESGYYFFTWIAFGCAAGANTVSVTFTGLGVPGNSACLGISEYAGGSSVDASTSNGQINVGTSTCSLTTTASADLLYLAVGSEPACTRSPTPPTGGNPLTPPVPPEAWLIVNEPSLSFTDRSSYLLMDGSKHSFDIKLRERGTANYTLVSDPFNPDGTRRGAPSTYEPTMGQPIYLYDQNIAGYTLEFAGLIQDYTIRWVGNQGLRYIDVSAVSLESVFDTVYVEEAMQFSNATCGAILTAIFNAFENGCPVSLGLIQAGATIPQFNAEKTTKLSDIFDQLATTSEFTWGVNPQTQQLYFCLPTAIPAPFTIQSANVLWDSISQKFDNADYRNRQAVKLSFDAFTHSEEYFVGAGTVGPFTLMRPLEQGVNAYITTATPNTATASFSGQPSPGDTITVGPAAGAWQGPSHVYAIGGYIIVSGFVFQVTTAGTSGLTEPNFLANTVTGDTVVDNSVIWTCRGTATLGSIVTSYEFVTALDNTQFGQILIGGTVAETVQNTVDALNAAAPYNGTPATQGRGLTFSLPTWENSQVNAITVTGTGFTATQKIPGSGNVASLTSTGTAFAWSSPNTSGGTSPQTSVGPNEGAWISIAIYAAGTSTSAPGLIYTQGSDVVTLATPLNVGTNLVVEYTRTDGNIIEVEDTASVAALAAISHGTGKYQQATDQSSTGAISTSAAAGLQFAQQILATFDVTQQKFELQFYRPGILPGQVLTLDLDAPLSAMNGSYLVLSIKGELVPTYPYLDNPNAPGAGHYRYTADLINTNLIGTDLAFWLGLGGGGAGGSGTAGALVATSGSSGNTSGQALTVGGVNEQTGSYTAIAQDNGKLIVFNDGSACTLTLPSAPPFAQWNVYVENIGAGTLTVSPNGLDIDGSASSLTLATDSGLYISTDGTNYFTERGAGGGGFANPMTTKGDVIVGAASGVPARLGVGTNGKVLTANSSATDGVDWESLPVGSASQLGIVEVDNTTITAAAGVISAVAGAGSPLTTKGDLYTYGTGNTRLAVGTNGKVLTANSSATDGIDYEAPIALTTTGTSGAASLTPGNPYTLNVPQYSGGGGGGAMVQIAQTILASPAANVTFSSIPGTYTNLQLVITARSSASVTADSIVGVFNTDNTAAHYTENYLNVGPTVGSGQLTTGALGATSGANSEAGSPGSNNIFLPNYSNTVFHKAFHCHSVWNNANSQSGVFREDLDGFWFNTAAINSIELLLSSGGNFVAGSIFTLYGLL